MDTTGANIPCKETIELEVFPDAMYGTAIPHKIPSTVSACYKTRNYVLDNYSN